MRRKAGMGLVVLTLAGLGVFAATGFGAGPGGTAKVVRGDAIHARVSFGSTATKAGTASSKVIYGSATVAVPVGDHTISLGKCPPKSHIVNGTLAALHGTQAPYFTIRGYGLASPKAWFVDVTNGSALASPPDGFPVKAVGFIVCQK